MSPEFAKFLDYYAPDADDGWGVVFEEYLQHTIYYLEVSVMHPRGEEPYVGIYTSFNEYEHPQTMEEFQSIFNAAVTDNIEAVNNALSWGLDEDTARYYIACLEVARKTMNDFFSSWE